MSNVKFSQFAADTTPDSTTYLVGYDTITNLNIKTLASDLPFYSGSGTQYYHAKFTAAKTIGNSLMWDDNTILKSIKGTQNFGLYANFTTEALTLGGYNTTPTGKRTRLTIDNLNNTIDTFDGAHGPRGISLNLQTSNYLIGNLGFSGNLTYLQIDDSVGVVKTSCQGNDKGLKLDFGYGYYAIGSGSSIGDQFWKGVLVGGSDVKIGDFDTDNPDNGVGLQVSDAGKTIVTYNNFNPIGLNLDFGNNNYKLGTFNAYTDVYLNVYQTSLTDGYITTTYHGQEKGLILNFDIGNYQIGNSAQGFIYDEINNRYFVGQRGDYTDGFGLDIQTSNYTLGDYGQLFNGTFFNINDNSRTITTFSSGNEVGLKLDFTDNAYQIGDFNGVANSTFLKVDDTNFLVSVSTSFKTANPTGGTAVPWRLGSVVSQAVSMDTTQYVEVEVDGVLRKLALIIEDGEILTESGGALLQENSFFLLT